MLNYRTLWRWHFYAGLFCIPFVVLLALTGAVYLFKPQLETLADRDVQGLQLAGQPASARRQVEAALAAVPGARLQAYELPRAPDAGVRVHVLDRAGERTIVYVHPKTAAVLKTVDPDTRIAEFVKTIHGELFLGKGGSLLVELAASWAIVMVLTGLILWWPRDAAGLAGVLYPRFGRGARVAWRDLHAVVGAWVSLLALFLLLTALPWTEVWGDALKWARSAAAPQAVVQDWSAGRADEHAQHRREAAQAGDGGIATAVSLDDVVARVAPLQLAPPVLVQPPRPGADRWTVKAESQNRPLRATLEIDAYTGETLRFEPFRDRPLLDRAIGIGIAAHEGQLFGLANQLLGLLTAAGLVTLCVSGVVMWWRRRPEGVLGAPAPPELPARVGAGVTALIVALGLLLPLLGLSLLLVALADRALPVAAPRVGAWLGLRRQLRS
jgi:uncharacterized iron-regulated membrane protein